MRPAARPAASSPVGLRRRASVRRRHHNEAMSENAFGAVYGTIVVSALLAAETARHETYLGTVEAVVIALLTYWLAHSYARLAAARLSTGESLSLAAAARTLAGELTILIGAAAPLAALLACWVAGVSLTSAVTASVWTSAVMLVVLEVAIGVRAELSGRELVGQVAIGVLLGALVIALQLVLH